MAARYQFGGGFDPVPGPSVRRHRRQTSSNSMNDDNDPTDGNGSLAYSATSSINSAAGESTDSSALIRGLELEDKDSKELAQVLEKERVAALKHPKGDYSVVSKNSVVSKHSLTYSAKGDHSVVSNNTMGYSTDNESAMDNSQITGNSLQGINILGTIAGQTSAQNEYDGGNYPQVNPGSSGGQYQDTGYNSQHQQRSNKAAESEDGGIGIIFEQAEHTDSIQSMKQKRIEEAKIKKKEGDKKKKERKQGDNQTPKVKNTKTPSSPVDDSGLRRSSPGLSPSSQMNQRPPKRENFELHEEEDVWYAKWWMFCFPDTVKTMTAKR